MRRRIFQRSTLLQARSNIYNRSDLCISGSICLYMLLKFNALHTVCKNCCNFTYSRIGSFANIVVAGLVLQFTFPFVPFLRHHACCYVTHLNLGGDAPPFWLVGGGTLLPLLGLHCKQKFDYGFLHYLALKTNLVQRKTLIPLDLLTVTDYVRFRRWGLLWLATTWHKFILEVAGT